MAGRLIIVTGPPGGGKTTLTRALAAAWPASAVLNIHSDDLWACFAKGRIDPWLPESEPQNRVVIQAMADQALTLAAGGYPVFLDGIFGPWFLDPFRQGAAARGVPLDYLVSRPSRPATIARGVAREGHPMRDPDVIGRMWDQFADLGPLEPHVLDPTDLSPADACAQALERLQSGALALA